MSALIIHSPVHTRIGYLAESCHVATYIPHCSCSKLSMTLPRDARYAGMKWSATIVLHSLTLPYASCNTNPFSELHSLYSHGFEAVKRIRLLKGLASNLT